MTETAISRVAAFAAAAEHRRPGTIHIDRVTRNGQSHDLTLDDLNAVLDALADACDGTERCAACGAVHCDVCGIGEGLTDCDPGHCLAGECVTACGECVAAQADDYAVEVADDLALEACES